MLMSFTDEDARRSRIAREAAIRAKLEKLSKQQNVTTDSKALQVLADYAVDEVQEQKTKLDERRKARAHFARSGNALQKFMSTLSQFLKAYSGLIDVANGVDNQYGGLVIGALSVLVQVGNPIPLIRIMHLLIRG